MDARLYAVAFVMPGGWVSPITLTSAVVMTTLPCDVPIPVGPVGTVARRLFRTQNILDTEGFPVIGRERAFYSHSTITDNTATIARDEMDDLQLGPLWIDLTD